MVRSNQKNCSLLLDSSSHLNLDEFINRLHSTFNVHNRYLYYDALHSLESRLRVFHEQFVYYLFCVLNNYL